GLWAVPRSSGDGTTLATETRVYSADSAARRRFHLYWLVVGPFSALIRRRWLAAARRAAESARCSGCERAQEQVRDACDEQDDDDLPEADLSAAAPDRDPGRERHE